MSKVLEFLDFSGGLTDHDLPGATDRFQIFDNVLIEQDKTVFQRPGIDILSSIGYQLPTAERVSKIINFDNDSELLATHNKKFSYLSSGVWTDLAGPTGNNAFNGNTADSNVTESQWNHHLYLASDSLDPPLKIYRDGGNTLRLRTAGLPKFTSSITPSDGGLVLGCALANDIWAKMKLHMASNTAVVATGPNNSATGHHVADGGGSLAGLATALAALVTATDLPSLIALLVGMRSIYRAHIYDAQIDPSGRLSGAGKSNHATADTAGGEFYYQNQKASGTEQTRYDWRHFLNFSLQDPLYTIPSSALIAQVLFYLNDLRDKWNWHNYAPQTHYNAFRKFATEYYTYLGAHATLLARVQPYTWAQITPNYGSFIQYVKDIKIEFDAHRTSGQHFTSDTTNAIPAGYSAPTDFWSSVTMLGALMYYGYLHITEASIYTAFYQFTGSSTATSSSLTSVSPDPTAILTTGFKAVPIYGTGATPFAFVYDDALMFGVGKNQYPVSGTTATTIGVSSALGVTSAGAQWLFTNGLYHYGKQTTNIDWQALNHTFNNQDFSLTTSVALQGFSTLAKIFSDALKVHEQDKMTINSALIYPGNPFKELQIIDYSYDLYHLTGGPFASGTDYTIHNTLNINNVQNISFYPISAFVSLSGFKQTHFVDEQPQASSINYRGLFRYDYGVYTTAVQKVLTGTTVNTSTTITMASTFGLVTTMGVTGSGIPVGSYITSISPNISITISAAATGSASVSLSFYGTKFQDFGPPSDPINIISFSNPVNTGASEVGKSNSAATLSNIYVYSNASNENWATSDTVNFRKEIYRTSGDGSVYYKINVDGVGGDVSNATTSVIDVSTDTYLLAQQELYTNGGTVFNTKPPLGAFVHVLDSRAYWAAGNKVYQSLESDPDSVPENFFDQLPEDITGLSSSRSNIVALTALNIYRLDGAFDELGQGFLRHERIFDKNGGFAPVKTDLGVFFVAIDGIYFTDAFQCFRVTDLDTTFKQYTTTAATRGRIQGAYDNFKKKVYWTIQTNVGYAAPDIFWVLDLQFGVSRDIEKPMPITTISSGSASFTKAQSYTNFRPTAAVLFNKQINFGDINGYIQKFDPALNLDVRVDTSVAATSWAKRAILWDIKTCNLNYGSAYNRKYFQRSGVQFKQENTNLSAQITSDADKGHVVGDLPVIRSRKLLDWGDSKIDPSVWANPAFTAISGSVIDDWRRFNGDGSLRSNFRAIELRNAYCVIVGSDQLGLINIASVSANVWSATLVNSASRSWPLYSVDYFLRILGVDYPITVRVSDAVVRVNDSGFTPLSVLSGAKFEIWGYPKNEHMHLVGMNVAFEDLGTRQKTYGGVVSMDGGENA